MVSFLHYGLVRLEKNDVFLVSSVPQHLLIVNK
jgi:hypothetical protein